MKTGSTWVQLERLTHSREGWRELVSNICYGQEDRHKKKKISFETAAIFNSIIN
jgi:hypothetical protein